MSSDIKIKRLNLTSLSQGRSMLRTTFIIADITGSMDITIWGPTDHRTVGSSYTFENVQSNIMKSKKKISSTPDTVIKRVEDVKNVFKIPVFTATEDLLEIQSAKIKSINLFCKSEVHVNMKISTTKFTNCGNRQLMIDAVLNQQNVNSKGD